MEFLLLFILNIFMGALVYLILSLKMERTSSTYQEQKLRKEMGEIITEFNATAERNISLLENKIALLRRLMGESGSIKLMDVTIDHKPENEKTVPALSLKSDPLNDNEKKDKKSSSDASGSAIITKKAPVAGEAGFLGGIIDKMYSLGKASDSKQHSAGEKSSSGRPAVKSNDAGTDLKDNEPVLKKIGSRVDYKSDDEIDIFPVDNNQSVEDDEDIAGLFMNSDDKYALILELSAKGYSIDELAGFSGIPAGEVKLVISLNN